MCGIHALVSTTARGPHSPSIELHKLLCNRGPDYTGHVHVEVKNVESSCFVSFTSTVLALRGGQVTPQPFIDADSGSVLCWNGEAWKLGQENVEGNDGQLVFDALIAAVSMEDASQSAASVLRVLREISGPFALVFLDNSHKQIYFSRDRLGRRSLLYNATPTSLEFASISDPSHGQWKEVEADAIYVISCSHNHHEKNTDSFPTYATIFPVRHYNWGEDPVNSLGKFNRQPPTGDESLSLNSGSVRILQDHLSESLKLRILNIPSPPGLDEEQNTRVAVLFSGGLDCTVLARMAHDLLPKKFHIDLINVAFENPRVVQAAKNAENSKKQAKHQSPNETIDNQTVETKDKDPSDFSPYEKCPDRETGRKAFKELTQVCPDRMWRFIAVNVPYAETMAHKARVIGLINPHNTEMDLSIAFALYFAARGSGIATTSVGVTSPTYTTPARVLLSGLGADELFGGYTRHVTAFNRKGFSGLLDELELDVNRLGKRNLGRDDRVISHWGREARFPFLDEDLVRWAVECPIWEKCGFQTLSSKDKEILEMEPGKKVLRLVAHKLGMHSVAQEKKRAIQFGARTAKMELGRTKGTTLIA